MPRAIALLLAAIGGARLNGTAARKDARKSALARQGSQALTPHASVHVVQWNGEELLLGCTAQQVTVLARKSVDVDGGGA